MSEYSKKAIYSKLSGDTAFAALLAKDENNNPGIYNTNLNQIHPVNFPCTTFRESDGTTDPRFRTITIGTEFFDFEIWADDKSGLTTARIAERLNALLHNQPITLSSGECYDCIRVTQSPDNYDPKLKLQFGLYRYKLTVRR